MKSISVLVSFAAAAILAASGTHAGTYIFELVFSDAGQSTSGGIFLDATADGGGVYTVYSANGLIDGSPVTLAAVNTQSDNDNVIYYPGLALDLAGISFLAAGYGYNLFYETTYQLLCNSPSCQGEGQSDNLNSFSLTEVATPEPATWALMLAGFAGLGAALRSRRASSALA